MPIKWYVNLDKYDSKNHHGTHARLLASLNPAARTQTPCDWRFQAVGTDNTDATYIAAADRARLESAQTAQIDLPGPKNRKFENKFHFPHVGGDTYEVACRLHGTTDDLMAEEFITWRKIYYTLNYVSKDCKELFDAAIDGAKQIFARSYVELVEHSRKKCRVVEKATEASTTNLAHLYSAKATALVHKPFHARIVMVEDIHDRVDVGFDEIVDANTNTTTADPDYPVDIWTEWLDDSQEWELNFSFSHELAASWQKKTGGVAAMRISVEKADGTQTVAPVDIKAYAKKVDNWTIVATLGNKASAANLWRALQRNRDGEDRQLRVRFDVGVRDEYCGHSNGNFTCIRINEGYDRGRLIRAIRQTIVHELGHGMQQTKASEPRFDGGGAPNGVYANGRHYTHHGGQGPHCNFHAHIVGGNYEHNAGKLCVMFHKDDDEVYADARFCNVCRDILKRTNLSAAQMDTSGWNLWD